jgi:hypothetical protein
MVPGTADGFADEQALGERTAVVRAGGTDREELLAASRQQDRLVPDVAGQHAAVGAGIDRNTSG